MRLAFLLLLLCGLGTGPAHAHEVRPAYLELRQTSAESFAVTWKQPVLGDQRLRLDPVFPEACKTGPETAERAAGALIRRYTLTCNLDTASIMIAGLDRTLTDVFLRINWLNGDNFSTVLRPGAPSVQLGAAESAGLSAYLGIGVEHILFGWDHLLFVVGLVLLVRLRQLVFTITAFTVAHSITLALSALGGISLPGAPVEIAIALSIALIALEAVHRFQGRDGLSARFPWLIAFGFGLIHGFGFAGALADIGLPSGTEAQALLLFNVGVEAGQLALIAALLATGWVIKRLSGRGLDGARYAAAYLVGISGIYWALERTAILFFAA